MSRSVRINQNKSGKLRAIQNQPSLDRAHPLLKRLRSGDRVLTALNEDLALQVCELVAMGHTLDELCSKDNEGRFPAKLTFIRWMLMYPHIKQAYEAALEVRTFSLEDEAIEAVRRGLNKPSQVPAIRALISQLQWSMEKGNAGRFGQKGVGQITVPIQINTSLDLGQGGVNVPRPDNAYEITVDAKASEGGGVNYIDFAPVEPGQAVEGDPKVHSAGQTGELVGEGGLIAPPPLIGGIRPPRRRPKRPSPNKLQPKFLPDGSDNPEWAEQEWAKRSAARQGKAPPDADT